MWEMLDEGEGVYLVFYTLGIFSTSGDMLLLSFSSFLKCKHNSRCLLQILYYLVKHCLLVWKQFLRWFYFSSLRKGRGTASASSRARRTWPRQEEQRHGPGRRQLATGNQLACFGLDPPGDCTSTLKGQAGHCAQSEAHLRGPRGGRGWQYNNVPAV